MTPPDRHQSLLHEIAEEKAGALARTGEKLEAALVELAAADAALAGAPSNPALAAARLAAVRAAADSLYSLLVQRDAIGPNNPEQIFQIYRIPGEVRRLLGTHRR